MALLTDGPMSNIEDLRAYDTQIRDVATVEGIDVTQKLALAQQEIAIEVEAMMGRHAAPGVTIARVVVTPTLKLWHQFRTLELIYRDAHNSQLNDRYTGKRQEFQEMARWAREKLLQTGLGLTAEPLSQAVTPTLRAAPGGLPDGTYYVAMAWTNGRGEEGASSIPGLINTVGSTFEVQPGTAVPNAVGWNVFAGTSPGMMFQQNGAAVEVGHTWLQPDGLVAGGRLAGTGQAATYFHPVPRTIQRG
jgi:hypothetical protein